MNVRLEASWKEALAAELKAPYFFRLTNFVREEYQMHKVYPPGPKIFRAFDACPFNQTRVVIIGQDPYHGPGQAHGLCFSVDDDVPVPPSLVNIFKEIQRDLGINIPKNGNLERWAQQGVLLLNATLTVRAALPGSHQNKGWEQFTDAAIQRLNEKRENLVFMLWGSYAQRKGNFIDTARHHVLSSPHPSPLSAHRGFMGNSHFSAANTYLTSKGYAAIQW